MSRKEGKDDSSYFLSHRGKGELRETAFLAITVQAGEEGRIIKYIDWGRGFFFHAKSRERIMKKFPTGCRGKKVACVLTPIQREEEDYDRSPPGRNGSFT